MPVEKVFNGIMAVLVLLVTLFAAMALMHELTSGLSPQELIHELESWTMEMGYRLALIVLAASGVRYLVNKKR